MGQIKFVGSLLLTAIFGVSLVLFMINFASDNAVNVSLADGNGFNSTKNSILANLSTYRTETINATDSFYKSEILEGETVRTGGQFKLGPGGALASVDNIISQSFKTIFGEDSQFGFVLNALLTFLAFVLGLLIWKTWKGGNPE